MDAILHKLQSSKYVSTLGLSSTYHQIPLKEESRLLTAFTVPGLGLFQFTRMPYGLSQAGATFQRLTDRVIGPEMEPYAFSYLDDIIIVTKTFEESMFGQMEVRYLGLLVNRDGFRPDPEKISPIVNYPVSRNLKQLRWFLGMGSWYRKFLKDFATLAEPLTRLNKKDRRYECTDEQQEAFNYIQAIVVSAPIQSRPNLKNSLFVKQMRVTQVSAQYSFK